MKNDLTATSSELVYGTTLRLPSDLISSESLQTSVTPTYVSKKIFNPQKGSLNIEPPLTKQQIEDKTVVDKKYQNQTFWQERTFS
ncbi:hypothetical protein TNCV_566481 [Trichonephila clavipes]|nr:hypothetical protein TNCV_566481 [Trichonephila clavipes]